MAAGTHYIGYDWPCETFEISDVGGNGYLIPVWDRTVIFEKVKELMTNDCKRKQIGDGKFE
jgi:hypothetical protein